MFLNMDLDKATGAELDELAGLTNTTRRNPFPDRVIADPNARLFNDQDQLIMCYAPPWLPVALAHPYTIDMIVVGHRVYQMFGIVPSAVWLATKSPAGEVMARALADHHNPVPR